MSTLIDTPNGKKQDPFIACRVNVIKWVSHFAYVSKRDSLTGSYATSEDGGGVDLRRASFISQGPPDSSLQEHRGSQVSDADSFHSDG